MSARSPISAGAYQHDVGRKAAEAAFGDKIKTTYVESVQRERPIPSVSFTSSRPSGNRLIFTTSFGYHELRRSRSRSSFPKVKFEHCTGYKRADNVATYNIRFYEGRYVQGVIAGKMSKSGVAAMSARCRSPKWCMGMNAFMQGMRSGQSQGPDQDHLDQWLVRSGPRRAMPPRR